MDRKKLKGKKGDIWLVSGILLIAAVSFFIIEFWIKQPGTKVVITVDGKVFGTYALEDDGRIEIETVYGKNTVVIEGGGVFMTEADCPDKICVKTGKISKTGETIVCLPHKVVVEVQAKERELDGVVQ